LGNQRRARSKAQQCSLAFTTYQSGKLFLVGHKADRSAALPFSIYNRNFPHCTGLSMPHAPRFYRERLWLLNSGTGEFGTVDLASGRFEPIAFCPGSLRGLSFCGDYAVVTLSRPRELSFQGLPLDERLEQKGAVAQCGLQVIDLRTGTVAEWLRLEAESVTELYDSVVLAGVRQPMALGFATPEIERLMVIDEAP